MTLLWAFLTVIALGIAAVVLAQMIVTQPLGIQQSEIGLAIAGGVIVLVLFRLPAKWFLYATLLALPFTQAPTIKILFRVRFSEVFAWILTPQILRTSVQTVPKLPLPVRIFLIALILYVLYTAIVGVVASVFLTVDVNSFTYRATFHPTLRPLLESARGVAAITLITATLVTLKTWDDLTLIIRLFVIGSVIASTYTLFQVTGAASDFEIPLLPGTLNPLARRPFATSFEPTGVGSFLAVAAVMCTYLILGDKGRRVVWTICLGLIIAALLATLSRAALIGAAAGFATIILLSGRETITKTLILAPMLFISLWIGYQLAIPLLGEDLVSRHLAINVIENRASPVFEGYMTQIHPFVLDYPFGVGQGNFIHIGGGAPGMWRLIVEGGFVGIVLLLLIHVSTWSCIVHLLRHPLKNVRTLAPVVSGIYVSALIISLNYLNTTDMWLWFALAMPMITRTAADIIYAGNGTEATNGKTQRSDNNSRMPDVAGPGSRYARRLRT